MKKILALLLALLLIAAMAVPAYAVTPKYEFPDLPEVPDISDDVHFELPDGFWDKWFQEHPIQLPVTWKPMQEVTEGQANSAMTEVLKKWTQ